MARKYPKDAPVPKAGKALEFPAVYNPSRVRKVLGWLFLPFVLMLSIPFIPFMVYLSFSDSGVDCGSDD